MEIKANDKATIRAIKTAKEYRLLAIVYMVCAVISMVAFFMLNNSINCMIMFAISLVALIIMFLNYNKLQDLQYDVTDCFIKTTPSHLEFKQLVDAEYQEGKIFLNDIKKIMKVPNGFQIWFANSPDSIFTIDKQPMQSEVICINFFAYDTTEFIQFFVDFLGRLPESAEKEMGTAEWKEQGETKDWLMMLLPAFLYIIPCILAFLLK